MATFVEGRKLEITIVSASDLPEVRHLGKMKVFAEVSFDGQPRNSKKSSADREGEANPTWNFTACYPVSEAVVQHPGVNLVVKLLCERAMGDRFIGEVRIPVKNLFDAAEESEKKILSYEVEGTPEGKLYISYSFGEKMALNLNAPAAAGRARKKSHSWLNGVDHVITTVGVGLAAVGLADQLFAGSQQDEDGDNTGDVQDEYGYADEVDGNNEF